MMLFQAICSWFLESDDVRTKKIIIPNKEETRFEGWPMKNTMIRFVHLGYHYQFKRDNF